MLAGPLVLWPLGGCRKGALKARWAACGWVIVLGRRMFAYATSLLCAVLHHSLGALLCVAFCLCRKMLMEMWPTWVRAKDTVTLALTLCVHVSLRTSLSSLLRAVYPSLYPCVHCAVVPVCALHCRRAASVCSGATAGIVRRSSLRQRRGLAQDLGARWERGVVLLE